MRAIDVTLPVFRTLFESAADTQALLTPDLRLAAVSDTYCQATMTERTAILGRELFEVFPDNPDDVEATGSRILRASLATVLLTRLPDKMPIVKYDVRRPEAEGGEFEERHWATVNTPILDDAGEVAWIVIRVDDVTEQVHLRAAAAVRSERARRQIEQLRATGSFLETLIDNLPEMLVVKSLPDYRFLLMNRATEDIMGLNRADLVGKTVHEFFKPEEAEVFAARDREVVESGKPLAASQDHVTTRSGSKRLLRSRKVPVRGNDGQLKYLIGVYEDITDQKATEQQLRQAVKMEAVGHLTGGVAHDFNNLLAIIIGNLDMAAPHGVANSALRVCIEEAMAAALRGSELTRRLLAFARNQPLHPASLDLNRNLSQAANFLRRTLGQRLTVEIHPAEELWPAIADSAQVDEAILNLAINARDAMSGDGTLTLESANVRLDAEYAAKNPDVVPGDYVQLSVSDNGTGMAPEVIEHCFEPFYTTKGVEHGTGLGLSMVYGFVKQSGGHIKIYSEPGHGTTVKIYLPRAADSPKSTASVAKTETAPPRNELLLVVEDNADLRKVTIRQLVELGYRVLSAECAEDALKILAEHPEIDLLFTDVVMPGTMTGTDLVREAQRRHPKLKALLTSGYPARSRASGSAGVTGVTLLQKPTRGEDLARTLRHILDRDSASTSSAPLPLFGH